MGISFSCPFSPSCDLENGLQSILVKSINLGGSREEELKTSKRSISFERLDSELRIMRSLSSGKMVLEGSISFKQKEMLETKVSIVVSSVAGEEDVKNRTDSTDVIMGMPEHSPRLEVVGQRPPAIPLEEDVKSPKNLAAIKLQKVYKSFRTRRKLADCAVLVEQSWWKLLDFAELRQSSISFFDVEKQETAVSRWSRAKTKAAKVGKGVSKCHKARKLALQHWLEAIDPRHRYGHNLHFYYARWLESQSREPFFYWLDIGEGKEVNLTDKCPRSKLQSSASSILTRKAYEIVIENGKLFYKQSGEILDTTLDPHSKWIFVLSTSKTLYVGKKKRGTFQHSSFLAGGATSAAGRLVVEKGILKAVWPHSGHYKPTPENFQDFLSYLTAHNVNLASVEMNPVDEDEPSVNKQKSSRLSMSNSTEDDLIEDNYIRMDEINAEEIARHRTDAEIQEEPKPHHGSLRLHTVIPDLKIPRRDDAFRRTSVRSCEANKVPKWDQHDEEDIVPKEKILQRINSHKETNSYQLGRQLSCKWTTGAGPRIGCLRDYPSELQSQALELVNLSPKSSLSSPKVPDASNLGESAPANIVRHEITARCRLQSSPLSKVQKCM
ncbi:hypothetical protein Droror1_Dr00023519 [Drosera rotundifolia]